ncbi:MAG: tyrosine-type recombinase/integrase [Verrucomicrobia bacterium]|nr:tyrosine-type recombinase/integrase [Verrucomicrobiota bacterium]
MKNRYRLLERRNRLRSFYCVDTHTGKRTSLATGDRDAAEQIVLAKNQATRQPTLNLQIARAYMAGSDSGVATRTWQDALDAVIAAKRGPTRLRWQRAAADPALESLRKVILIETRAEQLLVALRRGTVSTNVFLRRLNNFCLDMGWLPWPVLPKRQWPTIEFDAKRAVTAEEHLAIVAREPNPETRSFYELLWHLGGSQTDIATLTAENVNWTDRVVSYQRHKTGTISQLHFGERAAALLATLPRHGPLFPRLARMDEKHRAVEFKRRCTGLAIKGITLHSYRYAWAERAKTAGYPERFAQEALGHNSKAVHRAYARSAQVKVPSLEEYETNGKIVSFPRPPTAGAEQVHRNGTKQEPR